MEKTDRQHHATVWLWQEMQVDGEGSQQQATVWLRKGSKGPELLWRLERESQICLWRTEQNLPRDVHVQYLECENVLLFMAKETL